MKIVQDSITLTEIREMAAHSFGDMVKADVDVAKGIIALDAELHSDLEAILIENGSKQGDIWGINLYPELKGNEFIEFDSMINMRPSQGNKSRGIDNNNIRNIIIEIIGKIVKK
ncbi:MAG: DUF5674 family protein [bacterium]